MSLENSGLLSESKRSHTLRGGLYVGIGALYRNGLCLNRRHRIYSVYTQWLTILQRRVCVGTGTCNVQRYPKTTGLT